MILKLLPFTSGQSSWELSERIAMSEDLELRFMPSDLAPQGTVLEIIEASYRDYLACFPEIWTREQKGWKELDQLAAEIPGTWIFLSCCADKIVGMASFDPRNFPKAIIGHNCIIPEFRGRGFGKLQVVELLRRIKERSFTEIEVTTGDDDFFEAARRMYKSCGFKEVERKKISSKPFPCGQVLYRLIYECRDTQ